MKRQVSSRAMVGGLKSASMSVMVCAEGMVSKA
jgi:hypothetical protein